MSVTVLLRRLFSSIILVEFTTCFLSFHWSLKSLTPVLIHFRYRMNVISSCTVPFLVFEGILATKAS